MHNVLLFCLYSEIFGVVGHYFHPLLLSHVDLVCLVSLVLIHNTKVIYTQLKYHNVYFICLCRGILLQKFVTSVCFYGVGQSAVTEYHFI